MVRFLQILETVFLSKHILPYDPQRVAVGLQIQLYVDVEVFHICQGDVSAYSGRELPRSTALSFSPLLKIVSIGIKVIAPVLAAPGIVRLDRYGALPTLPVAP